MKDRGDSVFLSGILDVVSDKLKCYCQHLCLVHNCTFSFENETTLSKMYEKFTVHTMVFAASNLTTREH